MTVLNPKYPRLSSGDTMRYKPKKTCDFTTPSLTHNVEEWLGPKSEI